MSLIHATQLNPTGSYKITGSLQVQGTTTLQQTDPNTAALIISGAAELVKADLQSQIVSGSLTIQGLGTLSNPDDNQLIDLGGFF